MSDWFMNTADFAAYCATQEEALAAYRDPARWWRSALLNTARVGWFSSDRAVREYDEKIWRTR